METTEDTNEAGRIRWVGLLRIMMGTLFVSVWVENLHKGFYSPDGLEHFFTQVYPQSHNPLGWYAAFIQGVLLPNRALFAPFQLVMELSLGVLLLLGIATPLVALGAAAFLFNIYLATYGMEWPWTYLSLIVVCVVCALTRAGRYWGIDALIAARRAPPRGLPLW